MSRSVFQLAFLAGLLAVSVLSLIPKDELPTLEIWDKWKHLAAYATLALLAALAFASHIFRPVAAGLVLWGGVLELGQALVPGRSPEWLDVLANAIGVALAVALIHLTNRTHRRCVRYVG